MDNFGTNLKRIMSQYLYVSGVRPQESFSSIPSQFYNLLRGVWVDFLER
jgi:hypothetical protein